MKDRITIGPRALLPVTILYYFFIFFTYTKVYDGLSGFIAIIFGIFAFAWLITKTISVFSKLEETKVKFVSISIRSLCFVVATHVLSLVVGNAFWCKNQFGVYGVGPYTDTFCNPFVTLSALIWLPIFIFQFVAISEALKAIKPKL